MVCGGIGSGRKGLLVTNNFVLRHSKLHGVDPHIALATEMEVLKIALEMLRVPFRGLERTALLFRVRLVRRGVASS